MSQAVIYSLDARKRPGLELGPDVNTHQSVNNSALTKQKLIEKLTIARSYSASGTRRNEPEQEEKIQFISYLIDLAVLEAHSLSDGQEQQQPGLSGE